MGDLDTCPSCGGPTLEAPLQGCRLAMMNHPAPESGWSAEQWQEAATHWYIEAQESNRLLAMSGVIASEEKDRADQAEARITGIEAAHADEAIILATLIKERDELRDLLAELLAEIQNLPRHPVPAHLVGRKPAEDAHRTVHCIRADDLIATIGNGSPT